jgi:GntR family transcriptional repressor for pyruvate dehydrogenase complex
VARNEKFSAVHDAPARDEAVPTEPRLPVGRRKRAHDVADRLEALIAADEFGVGSRLPSEKELMARFGVGRPAVREALFMLQQQGRIEIGSGARALVVSPTPAFLVRQMGELIKRVADGPRGQDYLEQARLLFETGLAWQAAQNASDQDIERLRQALEANVAALGRVGEFIRTDVAFHYELARIARNPVFNVVHEILVEWLIDQRTTTIHMPEADSLSVRDHTAIYEAVAAREPARAFHEMASHLRLISRLYSEAKRLSETILRDVTRDVAKRLEEENEALWAASFGGATPPSAARPPNGGIGRRARRGKGVGA